MFEKTIDVLNRYGELLVNDYKDRLDRENITASGKLRDSVKYIVNYNDSVMELNLSLEDYWYYVENGRKAGKFPPIDKILSWIKAKPIIPEPYNGKLPTEQQLAFLISRSIAENGIEARKPLHNSIQDVLSGDFYTDLDNAITEDLSNMVDIEIMVLIKDI